MGIFVLYFSSVVFFLIPIGNPLVKNDIAIFENAVRTDGQRDEPSDGRADLPTEIKFHLKA